jgi:hypothetical protein
LGGGKSRAGSFFFSALSLFLLSSSEKNDMSERKGLASLARERDGDLERVRSRGWNQSGAEATEPERNQKFYPKFLKKRNRIPFVLF